MQEPGSCKCKVAHVINIQVKIVHHAADVVTVLGLSQAQALDPKFGAARLSRAVLS